MLCMHHARHERKTTKLKDTKMQAIFTKALPLETFIRNVSRLEKYDLSVI